jgi:hypothetical protein
MKYNVDGIIMDNLFDININYLIDKIVKQQELPTNNFSSLIAIYFINNKKMLY